MILSLSEWNSKTVSHNLYFYKYAGLKNWELNNWCCGYIPNEMGRVNDIEAGNEDLKYRFSTRPHQTKCMINCYFHGSPESS